MLDSQGPHPCLGSVIRAKCNPGFRTDDRVEARIVPDKNRYYAAFAIQIAKKMQLQTVVSGSNSQTLATPISITSCVKQTLVREYSKLALYSERDCRDFAVVVFGGSCSAGLLLDHDSIDALNEIPRQDRHVDSTWFGWPRQD